MIELTEKMKEQIKTLKEQGWKEFNKTDGSPYDYKTINGSFPLFISYAALKESESDNEKIRIQPFNINNTFDVNVYVLWAYSQMLKPCTPNAKTVCKVIRKDKDGNVVSEEIRK